MQGFNMAHHTKSFLNSFIFEVTQFSMFNEFNDMKNKSVASFTNSDSSVFLKLQENHLFAPAGLRYFEKELLRFKMKRAL